ncbi:hypothetical protein MTQ00_04870 [Chryseobacterium sp. B21-037]|uniref:hypothetical protein n=1 Tax=Chryseobacterium sp. B21-037 TaxID=2926038 RepID=UPI00235A38A6|nr:hypothetical protein [Chryseobacterium sp. B21-037]MDC8103866.1 hypothetical protein [Chryseobacterium sp. B21-037]
MKQNKQLKFILPILGLVILLLLTMVAGKIFYPLNLWVMICLGILIIALSLKLIYNLFLSKADQSLSSRQYVDEPGQKIFYISTFRTSLLSLSMIFLSAIFIYLFTQLFPEVIEEIYMEPSVIVILLMFLYVILFIGSIYCFLTGIKLFIRRKKIVQLIINDDSIEFLPVYDFGTATRNISALSLFFKKKMRKAYFTDQISVEKVNNTWNGDKIKIYIEGIGFYLPFLYDDVEDLEKVFQMIRHRLIKYIQFTTHDTL